MKFALIAAGLITFPAIIALIYAVIVGNTMLAVAALFSLGLNTLPFIAAGLLMGKRRDGGDDLAH